MSVPDEAQPAGAAIGSDLEELPLQHLYLQLVRAGLPIPVRDYLDALRALRAGHGVGGRERLHWLLRTLWARGDEETVRLDAVLRRLRVPTHAQVLAMSGRTPDALAGGPTAHGVPQAPDPTLGDGRALADDEPGEDASDADDESGAPGPLAGLRFAPAQERGLGLPSAPMARRPTRPYVFEPRLPLAERAWVVAWRRLRRLQRQGVPVELDIDATIERYGRTGYLTRPVLVPARRNLTRVLVLIDASPSMRPWRRLLRPLNGSMQQARLAASAVFYFDNDPRGGLYETPQLLGRLHDCETTLREHAEAVLVVLGDAGTARAQGSRLDRERLAGTADFIRRAHAWLPNAAWLNPLPAARWGHAADVIRPQAAMFEVSEEGLTRAVDHLRGLRPA